MRLLAAGGTTTRVAVQVERLGQLSPLDGLTLLMGKVTRFNLDVRIAGISSESMSSTARRRGASVGFATG